MQNRPHKNIVIVGPTGSGKSALALKMAESICGEIVSCDSVQVYKYFNIGSAKPSSEEQERIPHHLIDLVHPSQDFDAATYATLARKVIQEINSRGKPALIVGGTGLYLYSLMCNPFNTHIPHDPVLRQSLTRMSKEELLRELQIKDPERARQIHPHDHFRLARALEIISLTGEKIHPLPCPVNEPANDNFYVIKIFPLRPLLHEQIEKRSEKMLRDGLVDEVEELIAQEYGECRPMQSIGYKQVKSYLSGQLSQDELLPKIIAATRQYAKRQYTWFKKLPHKHLIESAAWDDHMRLLAGEITKQFQE